jgi:tetratricopeptide (TPR) repeat protein
MDAQDVLFVLFGFQITIASIFTAAGGLLTVGLGAYKLFDYWRTRERRRLDMLREYLDREEKNITGRRSSVLNSIRLSEHAYLAEKKLDVGAEIDRVIDLLDRGYPQTAAAKLAELEQRLLTDERMLRERADDLQRHTRSVRVFLGALADREGDPVRGLGYIDKALNHDGSDLDALKFKALLLFNKGELDNALGVFDRLGVRAAGPENACYRADAHLGTAKVKFARGPENFNTALQSVGTALTNITQVPSAEQDHFTFSEIYELQGDIYASTDWSGTDAAKAVECYRKEREALNLIPRKRDTLEKRIRVIEDKMGGLQNSVSH